MNQREAFDKGAQFGSLMMLGAMAVNWFLSGASVSLPSEIGAVAVAATSFAGAWWVRRRVHQRI